MMIRTITDDVAPAAVALALPHAHVLHSIGSAGAAAATPSAPGLPLGSSDSASDIRSEDLCELRSSPAALGGRNLVLEKEDEAFRELELFATLLDRSDSGFVVASSRQDARPLVVDVTVPAEGRDAFMAKRVRIAKKLTMHVVAVTTCDVTTTVFSTGLSVHDRSERLAKTLETDLLFGFHADAPVASVGGATTTTTTAARVCAGAIYQQVHTTRDGAMSENDRITAHAIALAQQRTGAPVYLSFSLDAPTPRDANEALQHERAHRQAIRNWLTVLLEHGAASTQLVVCHADQWCDEPLWLKRNAIETIESSHSFLQSLLQRGVCLLFSMIGLAAVSDAVVINPCVTGVPDTTTVLSPLAREPPRDSSIAQCIAQLIREHATHTDQLLLANSVQQRVQYTRYGGSGYLHVFTHFQQRLLQHGVTPSQYEQLVCGNPLRLLSWYTPPTAADVPKDYLTCSICRSAFEPIVGEYFTKFAFTYCGTKCLRRHSRQGFAALPVASATTTMTM